jgi:hypothetical protein
MAGLVPAIHVFTRRKQDVDARHNAGHDDRKVSALVVDHKEFVSWR